MIDTYMDWMLVRWMAPGGLLYRTLVRHVMTFHLNKVIHMHGGWSAGVRWSRSEVV